jgi:dTDP-4-amino-4,6-dideoxygalactose transaminase
MKKFIPFSQPMFGKAEINEVAKAMESGWVTLGPKTKDFEEQFAKYVGSKYAVGVTSCTAALFLSLISAGIGDGDEVITTIFTFAATANAIIHTGAKPVFVDIEKDTFNIDPKKIQEKITKKTKAIIPVHYAGLPVNLDAIYSLAKKNNLLVIEDAAHAIGSKYKSKMIGSFGNLVSYSFHPIKNISTGDGGMITTDDEEVAQKLSRLRLHGMSKDAWKRHSSTGSWRYDILEAGYKYNMTDIAAALGIHQLKKLEKFIEVRTKYADIYTSLLGKIPEVTVPTNSQSVRNSWNLYTVKVDAKKLSITRDEIIEELKKMNIGVSVYFVPLHLFTYYKKYGYKPGDFPVAEKVFEGIVSLPLYPKMTKGDVVYVAKSLEKIISIHQK